LLCHGHPLSRSILHAHGDTLLNDLIGICARSRAGGSQPVAANAGQDPLYAKIADLADGAFVVFHTIRDFWRKTCVSHPIHHLETARTAGLDRTPAFQQSGGYCTGPPIDEIQFMPQLQ
jgi:hypothetical protein